MLRMRLWAALAFASFATIGCFQDEGPPGGDSCLQGEQRSCDCPGDPGGGVQVCVEGGGAFEECVCDGASSGVTMTDGTSGATVSTSDATSAGPTTDDSSGGATTAVGTSGGLPIEQVTLYLSSEAYAPNFAVQANGGPILDYLDGICGTDGMGRQLSSCSQYVAVLETSERSIAEIGPGFNIPDDTPDPGMRR